MSFEERDVTNLKAIRLFNLDAWNVQSLILKNVKNVIKLFIIYGDTYDEDKLKEFLKLMDKNPSFKAIIKTVFNVKVIQLEKKWHEYISNSFFAFSSSQTRSSASWCWINLSSGARSKLISMRDKSMSDFLLIVIYTLFKMVARARLELAQYCYRRILNPLCLPFHHRAIWSLRLIILLKSSIYRQPIKNRAN